MKQMIEFEGICRRKVFIDPEKIVSFGEAVSFMPAGRKKGSIIYLVGDSRGIYIQESCDSIKEFLLEFGVEQVQFSR